MNDLSIIIVNYKSPRLVMDCLETVYAQQMSLDFTVIVVDNNSGDSSRALITAKYPEVRWIQMSYNAGFARANNEGIRQSDSNAVLLLNSDTLVEENAIERSYHDLMRSGYVACGVQLLNPDRTPQISGSYFFKGGLNVLLPLPVLGKFYKWLGESLKVKKPHVPEATGIAEVDWINGAYLMVKRDAIKKAGLLDEDFFLYAEEAEWCSRLGKQGRLCVFGEYHVIHLQGETANQTFRTKDKGYYNLYDKKGLQIMVSNFLRIRKQLGTGWMAINLVNYILEIPLFAVVKFVQNIVHFRNPFVHFNLVTGYSRNVCRLLALMPKMVSNKPHFYKIL